MFLYFMPHYLQAIYVTFSHLKIMNISFSNGYCCFLWTNLLAVYFEHHEKPSTKVIPNNITQIKIDKTSQGYISKLWILCRQIPKQGEGKETVRDWYSTFISFF